MMCGNARDIYFCDYEKYGFTDKDFEDDDNVVAECEYKEVEDIPLLEQK